MIALSGWVVFMVRGLHTMFSVGVNTMCNNGLFSYRTMAPMDSDGSLHETTRRLYEAAKAVGGDDAPAKVAVRMNISPQTLQNWEPRGVSRDGALKAQATYGCDANWILSGTKSPLRVDRSIVRSVARTLLKGYSREKMKYDFTEEWGLFADLYDAAITGDLHSVGGEVTIGRWIERKALQGASSDGGRVGVPASGTSQGN